MQKYDQINITETDVRCHRYTILIDKKKSPQQTASFPCCSPSAVGFSDFLTPLSSRTTANTHNTSYMILCCITCKDVKINVLAHVINSSCLINAIKFDKDVISKNRLEDYRSSCNTKSLFTFNLFINPPF